MPRSLEITLHPPWTWTLIDTNRPFPSIVQRGDLLTQMQRLRQRTEHGGTVHEEAARRSVRRSVSRTRPSVSSSWLSFSFCFRSFFFFFFFSTVTNTFACHFPWKAISWVVDSGGNVQSLPRSCPLGTLLLRVNQRLRDLSRVSPARVSKCLRSLSFPRKVARWGIFQFSKRYRSNRVKHLCT